MSDQPGGDPRFELGQEVLVDEGPRGLHKIIEVEQGMIPAVGEGLGQTEEPGYWYTVATEDGPYRAPEYNISLPGDAASADLAASEAPAGGDGPTSVEDRLRAGYKAGQGERRKTIEIAPGRYHDLAAEFKPIDWDLRRKLIRIAGRKGEGGHEADLRINSQLMADACVSMMFRPAPGQDYAPLHTLVERFKGGEPVRFDERLAQVLGIELIGGESEGDICRLVFGDPGVFEAHYMVLNGWSLQAFGDEEDEEDEGGGERPT